MADIVERLRDPKVYIPGEELLHEAADEITRLRSERSNLLGTVRLHKERAEAFAARVKELEGALKDLVRLIDEDQEEDAPPYLVDQVLDRARAALEGKHD